MPIFNLEKIWTYTLERTTPRRKASPYSGRSATSDTDFVVVPLDMGKSNKFDYTNRANSGAKLGQIIGAAVQKEAEKVKADAERHSRKARKQSLDTSEGCADIDFTKHIIDLKAPNKDLGDEGVCALADGLEIALRSRDSLATLVLEDLDLSGNGITTLALARLASIITLSECELKTINLAGNRIKVDTDDEAEQWEVFLRAFRHCFRLRRLDLSSNPDFGSRALEILARLHASEDWIDPVKLGGETSVQSFISYTNEDENVSPIETSIQSSSENGSTRPDMTKARILKRRCGLRSLPYLTLRGIRLDDAGALWLSYVLQDHHYPNQLIDEANATHAESAIKTYQQSTQSRGLDWFDDESAGKEGLQLLEKTEALRHHIMLDGITTRTRVQLLLQARNRMHADDTLERQSVERRGSRAGHGDRRASIRSIRTDDGGEHEATELQSTRRRIQRNIIANDGANSVELWKAALKVFLASRSLLYIAPITNLNVGGSLFITTPADSPIDSQATYASKLATTSEHRGPPELVLTEVSNTPDTPLRLQRPTARKQAFRRGPNLEVVTKQLNGTGVESDDQERYLSYQRRRIKLAQQAGSLFRNVDAACRLPHHLIEGIIGLTMSAREFGVLSGAQKADAVKRGHDRGTLIAGREWLKNDDSAQVWLLLDSINCLSYTE